MNRNQHIRLLAAAAVLAALLVAPPAWAQTQGAGYEYDRDDYPYRELVRRPLTLPGGLLELGLPVRINLTDGSEGEPTSIPAFLNFGLSDDFTIGVFHGTGICVSGDDSCAEVYDDVGAQVLLNLARGPAWQFIAEAGLLAFNFDDPFLDGFAGLGYKRTFGNAFGLVTRADILFAANRRDEGRDANEVLSLDAEGQLQLFPGLTALGFIGAQWLIDETDLVDETFNVPVGVGAQFTPVDRLDLGAQLVFPNLLGEGSTADVRELVVFARLFI